MASDVSYRVGPDGGGRPHLACSRCSMKGLHFSSWRCSQQPRESGRTSDSHAYFEEAQRGKAACPRSPSWEERGGIWFWISSPGFSCIAQYLGWRSWGGEARSGCWGDSGKVYLGIERGQGGRGRWAFRVGTEWGYWDGPSAVLGFYVDRDRKEGFSVVCPGQGCEVRLDKAKLGKISWCPRPKRQWLSPGRSEPRK